MTDLRIEVVGDGEFRVHHDREAGSLSVTVAMALDELSIVEAEEALGALGRHLDPDALDGLFRPIHGEPDHPPSAHLEVEIRDCRVTVYSDGTIRIRE